MGGDKVASLPASGKVAPPLSSRIGAGWRGIRKRPRRQRLARESVRESAKTRSLPIWEACGGRQSERPLWHITWSVNSGRGILSGYRICETPERQVCAHRATGGGCGRHNNRTPPRDIGAKGHTGWEFGPAWLTVRVRMLLDLATNVSLPSPGQPRPSARAILRNGIRGPWRAIGGCKASGCCRGSAISRPSI
jgi:hypothetical protein